VSIEMLEAVGRAQYGTFFAACERLLRAGGRAVIQVITIADGRYDEYLRRPDWIQKHIFPGGHLPSLAALDGARRRRSSLALRQIETFGADYARTLGEWRTRFLAAEADLERLGYEREFRRRWEYYLSYCEAGFRLGEIDVCQMVLEKPAAG
jgi:cyclopropane-fatty-acyl-phospholipid synthase